MFCIAFFVILLLLYFLSFFYLFSTILLNKDDQKLASILFSLRLPVMHFWALLIPEDTKNKFPRVLLSSSDSENDCACSCLIAVNCSDVD